MKGFASMEEKGSEGEESVTFMGCTGRGMPKTAPVTMLKSPEKTRVDDRSIEPCRARAIMSGSRVPRSPRAPEISATGDSRSVRRLCRLRRASSDRNGAPIFRFVISYLFGHCRNAS